MVRKFPMNLLEVKEIATPPYSVPFAAAMPSKLRPSGLIPDLLDRRFLTAKRHQEAQKLGSLINDQSLNLRQLVSEYEENVFANLPDHIRDFKSRINGMARECGLLSSAETTAFLDMGEVSPHIHEALLHDREYPYFDRWESPPVEEFPVFTATPNEFLDPSLPRQISMVSHRHMRSRFPIFGMAGATLLRAGQRLPTT